MCIHRLFYVLAGWSSLVQAAFLAPHPPGEGRPASDRTADYQAYRSILWALNSAWRKGEAAAFQALFEELPPGLRSSVRDGLLERACGLSQGSTLEGQEAILQALVEVWGALPTRLTLREVARGPGSQATQVLLRRSWQAAKAWLDQAAGRGDLAGVQRAIFRGIMPDLTTWAHASLGGQHEVLAHLAPYGLSQAELEATAQAWSGSKRALYQTLLLMGAREGQLALIELVEQKAPELFQDTVRLERALRQAVQAGASQVFAPLQGYVKEGRELLALELHLLAMEKGCLATVEALEELFPCPFELGAIALLVAAVKGGRVELFEKVLKALCTPVPTRRLFARLEDSHLTLPMLKALTQAFPSFFEAMPEHKRLAAVCWEESLPTLTWLAEKFPDLSMSAYTQEQLFVYALRKWDLASLQALHKLIPSLSFTAAIGYGAYQRGDKAILAYVKGLRAVKPLSDPDLKEMLLGVVACGDLGSKDDFLAAHPRALVGIQGSDAYGNDHRYALLCAAIKSGHPEMVAWCMTLTDEPWLVRWYPRCLAMALQQAPLAVCQELLALQPSYTITARCLDKALLNEEHAVFDWLQAYAPQVGPSPHALRYLTQGHPERYAWLYELQQRGLSLAPGLHHFDRAIAHGDLVMAIKLYRANPQKLGPGILPGLDACAGGAGQELLLGLLQSCKGAQGGYYRQALMAHAQGAFPSHLVELALSYLPQG